VWSRGLKARFGIGDPTGDDIVAEDLGGTVVVSSTPRHSALSPALVLSGSSSASPGGRGCGAKSGRGGPQRGLGSRGTNVLVAYMSGVRCRCCVRHVMLLMVF